MLTEEQIKSKICKALRMFGNTVTFEDVVAGLVNGTYQLFQNDHGVCITEIKQGTTGVRFLYIFICAGELPGVLDLLPTLEAHARAHGCKWIESTSRLGFDKIMPAIGFKKKAIVFARELVD